MIKLISSFKKEYNIKWDYVKGTKNTYQDYTLDYIVFKIEDFYILCKAYNNNRVAGEERLFKSICKNDNISGIIDCYINDRGMLL